MPTLRWSIVTLTLAVMVAATTLLQLAVVVQSTLLSPGFLMEVLENEGFFHELPAAMGDWVAGLVDAQAIPRPLWEVISGTLRTIAEDAFSEDWTRAQARAYLEQLTGCVARPGDHCTSLDLSPVRSRLVATGAQYLSRPLLAWFEGAVDHILPATFPVGQVTSWPGLPAVSFLARVRPGLMVSLLAVQGLVLVLFAGLPGGTFLGGWGLALASGLVLAWWGLATEWGPALILRLDLPSLPPGSPGPRELCLSLASAVLTAVRVQAAAGLKAGGGLMVGGLLLSNHHRRSPRL
ncbi:MAG: hypothetical protein AB1445_14475 [Bacillota bacterium]